MAGSVGTSTRTQGQFVQETFRLIRGTLGAAWVAYYRVDARQNLRDFSFAHVPSDFHRTYQREMSGLDPLHIRRVESHGVRVARLADALDYAPADDVRHYGAFLERFAVCDTHELLFRDGTQRVRAGLSLCWTRNGGPPAPAVVALLEPMQRYLEFTWRTCTQPPHEQRRRRAIELGLTPREWDVARLVCAGQTDRAIAACLGVKPSTVKSHLKHIFDKCDVTGRTALVSRLSDASD